MRDDIRAIMQADADRRRAREIQEWIDEHTPRSNGLTIVNENAPAWRNPELHGATTLEPTHGKRPYKRTRSAATKTPRRVPAFAGSLDQLDLARAGVVKLQPNHVKVTRADGTTEIVPQSSYRAAKTTHAVRVTRDAPTTTPLMPESSRLPSIHLDADDTN